LCLQHHAPVRGSKRHRAVMSISANRGQWSDLILSGDHGTIELKNHAKASLHLGEHESQQGLRHSYGSNR